MEDRLALDDETTVPLSLLDDAPWQHKTPIQGVYEKGLDNSLIYFGRRDRLKIWPHPTRKGRYIILNGHQRKRRIFEYYLDEKIKEHFFSDKECSLAELTRVKSDPANKKKIESLSKSVINEPISVQIISQLDADTPLRKKDAILFTSTFDRNHAKPDEVKLAENYREIIKNRAELTSDGSRNILLSRIKQMVRPELPTVSPNPVQPDPAQATFEFADPGTFTPTASEPWGPVPPDMSHDSQVSTVKPEKFIPLVLSLTIEGYKDITESLLRSRSRIFREHKLKEALEKLERLTTDTLDGKIDSIVAETALTIINKHIEAESDGSE